MNDSPHDWQRQEARRLETRVAESARILDGLMRSSFTPLVLLDPNLNFVRVNEAYAQACAKEVEDFPGHNHFVWYPSEELEATFRQVVESKQPWETEARPFVFPDHSEWGTTYWDLSLTPLLDDQGKVEYLVFSLKDVTERVTAQQELEEHRQHLEDLVSQRTGELRESEQRYRTVADYAYGWEWWMWPDGSFAYVSPSAERVTGYPAQSFMLDPAFYHTITHEEDVAGLEEHEREAMANERPRAYEFRIVRQDGQIRWLEHICQAVYDTEGNFAGRRGSNRDVTARKQVEAERQATLELLRLVNSGQDLTSLLREATGFLQRLSGCDAVGIRLRDGGDFPYFETTGFSADFVAKETHLCATDERLGPLTDEQGNPRLECVCGAVLSGRVDPSLPCFTPAGSFWTNSTTDLLAGLRRDQLGAAFRGRCVKEGYESVALVPFRVGDEVLGLVQFNDRGRDRFTLDDISCFERLTSNLAVAVAQRQAEAERERLLHDLEVERARFAAVLEQAPLGIIVGEAPSGKLILSNAEVERIFRHSFIPSADIGEYRAWQGLHPDGQPYEPGEWPLARALTSGEVVRDEEVDIIRGDDTHGTISLNAAPVRDADGKIVAGVVAFGDITYRRWAEEELHKYQEHLEELIDERTRELEETASQLAEQHAFSEAVLATVATLIMVLDNQGRIVRFNRACEETTGYTFEEVEGRPFWDFLVLPEEADQVRDTWQELINNLANRNENHWVTKDGGRRLISFNNTVLVGPEGLVEYVIASGLDVTEHRELEQALAGSEEKYRSLVNEANVMVLSMNPAGELTFMSPYALKFFGYTEEEVLGRNALGIIVPETDSEGHDLSGMVSEIAGRPDAYGYHENENITKNGQRMWMSWSNQPLYGAEGEVVGLLSIGVDRTEQKRAEEMLHDYRESLRSLASELALAEERERRRIAVGIHDHVSQTLALAKMRLGSLRRSSLGLPRDESLAEVEKLVDQVIDHTRTLTFELSPPILYELGLNPALEWVCEATTSRHGLPCYLEGTPKLLPLADDVRVVLFQGVRELLNNTVKHAQAGRATVAVRREENWVHITVEDDGVGFDTADLGRAVGEKQSFGLFNIRERLQYLGGYVEIESTPGEGTRVTLTAPLVEE